MSTDTPTRRLCPCCGIELPLGLFAHEPRVAVPRAVLDMNGVGYPVDNCYDETVISAAGRWFVACRATLPLDWDESPVTAGVWVEVDRIAARRVMRTLTGEETSCDFSGHLACDMPGFSGTTGARTAVHFDPSQPDPRPRVRRCGDSRLEQMHGHGGHDGLVALYRRCWNEGKPAEVVAAHVELRHTVAERWRELIDRPTFRTQLEPPPRMAGIQPAELLVAPPMDTGGVVTLATLGNAEANPKDAVEVVTFARNVTAGERFSRCFGEFAYWSRGTASALKFGSLIDEKQSIPETADMSSWLLCDPWWLPWEQEADARYAGVRVRLLAAVPVHANEVRYGRERGTRALMETLELAEADVSDLQREPVVH